MRSRSSSSRVAEEQHACAARRGGRHRAVVPRVDPSVVHRDLAVPRRPSVEPRCTALRRQRHRHRPRGRARRRGRDQRASQLDARRARRDQVARLRCRSLDLARRCRARRDRPHASVGVPRICRCARGSRARSARWTAPAPTYRRRSPLRALVRRRCGLRRRLADDAVVAARRFDRGT